ncbi:VWA domain-containing protein [Desulfolucanica intricata]|uniref:VWA domain-containing protein n=1 Tax=Desulfolucanica intricata TaxID=1285191 RepID=UPI00082A1779|nr:VWA domain-containing protein [Desulfolucanica intricata]
MLYRIPEFIQLCRQAGLKIAPSEVSDLLEAINLLGWQKENVYEAMLTTLVKEEKDRISFEKLFHYFYDYLAKNDLASQVDIDELIKNPPRMEPGEFLTKLSCLKNWIKDSLSICNDECKENCEGNTVTTGGRGGSGQGKSAKPAMSSADKLVLLLQTGSIDDLKAFTREHIDQLKSLKEQQSPDFTSSLQELKVSMSWAEAQHTIKQKNVTENLSEVLKWQENNKQLNRIIRDELEKAFLRKWPEKAINQIIKNVNTKELEFNRLSEDQVDEIRKALKRLTRKLAARCGYRYTRARRGMIDLRRTSSRSVQTGGIPLKLFYRHRIKDKPEMAVIYDLSGSVALFSEFMLQLVYTLHKSFKKVHSFAFVDQIAETTDFIKGENLTREIKEIIEKTKISKTNFSNYGHVWKQFVEQYLKILTPKTTILILGDARNNWNPTGEEYLEVIKKASKKIIWLNPAPLEKWNTEDSIINIYAPYCHQVFECRNLHQLEAAALRIF